MQIIGPKSRVLTLQMSEIALHATLRNMKRCHIETRPLLWETQLGLMAFIFSGTEVIVFREQQHA
jgi:hypothetical protein